MDVIWVALVGLPLGVARNELGEKASRQEPRKVRRREQGR